MKTLNKILLAMATSTVVMTGANAALYDNSTSTHNVFGYAGQPYVGLKVGQFNTDFNVDGLDSKKPTAYGIYGGYQFDPNWSAEVEFMGSDKADFKANGTTLGDVKSSTYGIYGVYRYPFANTNVYGKAKLGIARSEVKVNVNSFTDTDGTTYAADRNKGNKTGIAGGLGLGYNISPQFAVEAEYSFQPKPTVGQVDVKADAWTIGAHMKF